MNWFRLVLRDFRFHPILWGLSILGIAIGVGGWIGMESATRQAMDAFETSLTTTLGQGSHVVEPRRGRLSQEVYFDLARSIDQPITPILETDARLNTRSGTVMVRVLGIDPLSYGGFQTSDTSLEIPVDQMVTGERTLLVTRDLSTRPGDIVKLTYGTKQYRYQINTVLDDPDLRKTVWMDLGRFQLDLAERGSLSRIMLYLKDDDLERVKQIVDKRGLVLPRGQRTRSVRSIVSAFHWNLRALSYLSLFVGAFLVFSTMFLYSTRQRRMVSLLKTVGVSNRYISLILFGGLGLMGVIGSSMGLGVGWVLSGPMGSLVQGTVDQLYLSLSATGDNLTLTTAFFGWGLGLGMSFLGGVGPLISQLDTPYRAWVQREQSIDDTNHWRNPCLLAWVICWTGALISFGLFSGVLAGFVACFLVALGGSFLGPVLIGSNLNIPFPGLWNRLAGRNIRFYGSTTAVMVAVLVSAFSMVLSVTILVDSFRGSVYDWIDRVVRADYYVRSAPGPETRDKPPLSQEFLKTIRNDLKGHGELSALYEQTIFTKKGNPITIRGINPEVLEGRLNFQFRESVGDPWQRLREGKLWISEPGAYRLSLSTGDHLDEVAEMSDSRPLRVGAIYNEYGTEWASGYVSKQRFRELFGPSRPESIALFLDDPSLDEIIIKRARQYGYVWESRTNLRTRALKQFDRTFAVTDLMNGVAVVVAGVGFLILLLSFFEMRSRLWGRLSAIGVSRQQITSMIFRESGMIAFYATLVSIPTGIFLAWILIYVINRRSFGWLIPMKWSGGPFLMLGGLVALTVVISIAGPLYRLWTTSIHQWLRRDTE